MERRPRRDGGGGGDRWHSERRDSRERRPPREHRSTHGDFRSDRDREEYRDDRRHDIREDRRHDREHRRHDSRPREPAPINPTPIKPAPIARPESAALEQCSVFELPKPKMPVEVQNLGSAFAHLATPSHSKDSLLRVTQEFNEWKSNALANAQRSSGHLASSILDTISSLSPSQVTAFEDSKAAIAEEVGSKTATEKWALSLVDLPIVEELAGNILFTKISTLRSSLPSSSAHESGRQSPSHGGESPAQPQMDISTGGDSPLPPMDEDSDVEKPIAMETEDDFYGDLGGDLLDKSGHDDMSDDLYGDLDAEEIEVEAPVTDEFDLYGELAAAAAAQAAAEAEQAAMGADNNQKSQNLDFLAAFEESDSEDPVDNDEELPSWPLPMEDLDGVPFPYQFVKDGSARYLALQQSFGRRRRALGDR